MDDPATEEHEAKEWIANSYDITNVHDELFGVLYFASCSRSVYVYGLSSRDGQPAGRRPPFEARRVRIIHHQY
jgi:hypothetical protein